MLDRLQLLHVATVRWLLLCARVVCDKIAHLHCIQRKYPGFAMACCESIYSLDAGPSAINLYVYTLLRKS
jgi:hypothetical protein